MKQTMRVVNKESRTETYLINLIFLGMIFSCASIIGMALNMDMSNTLPHPFTYNEELVYRYAMRFCASAYPTFLLILIYSRLRISRIRKQRINGVV